MYSSILPIFRLFTFLDGLEQILNRESIPYTVFIDSLISELNNTLLNITDTFIFDKLIGNLESFNQLKYLEFKMDATQTYKDVNFKYKGIINQ